MDPLVLYYRRQARRGRDDIGPIYNFRIDRTLQDTPTHSLERGQIYGQVDVKSPGTGSFAHGR